MKSARTHRRKAREAAMQALFQVDFHPELTPEAIASFIRNELKFPALEDFALSLVQGTRHFQASIDELIRVAATNWKIERMNPVDRAVIRLAVYEMTFAEPATPMKVAITEAVEICKRFSTDQSSRFVNGVLNAVAEKRTADAGPINPPDGAPSEDETGSPPAPSA